MSDSLILVISMNNLSGLNFSYSVYENLLVIYMIELCIYNLNYIYSIKRDLNKIYNILGSSLKIDTRSVRDDNGWKFDFCCFNQLF